MAVHPDIYVAVLDEVGSNPVVIVDVVADELKLRRRRKSTASLARSALASLPAWWKPLDTSPHVELEAVREAQADVADGWVLSDDEQHWAESVIIALTRQ